MRRPVAVVLLCWLAVPTPAAAVDGDRWAWPLAGPRELGRMFTPPATRYGSGHRGADLPAAAGAAVLAAGAGRVSYAGLLAGRGVVVVTHGALRTTYEPVTAAVEVGDVVPVGGLLGALDPGHAGCPVGACLHWGLRRGDDYLDPVRLVVAGPVRLLPPGPAGRAPVARSPDSGPGNSPGAGRPTAHAAAGPGARGTPPTASVGPAPDGLRRASEARHPPTRETAVVLAALVTGLGLLVPRTLAAPSPSTTSLGTSGPGRTTADPSPVSRGRGRRIGP